MAGETNDNTKINENLYQNKKYKNINIFTCGGSTAMGFRPNHKSITGFYSAVYSHIKTIDTKTKLVINMGQVDMDVLYTYRCIKEGIILPAESFIDGVLDKYLEGLLELKKLIPNICVFGINPPSMLTIRTMLSITGQSEFFDRYKTLSYDFVPESRTENSRLFNVKLKEIALSNGFKYTDAWDRLYDGSGSTTKLVHRKYHHPEYDDYHIYTGGDHGWNEYFFEKIRNL